MTDIFRNLKTKECSDVRIAFKVMLGFIEVSTLVFLWEIFFILTFLEDLTEDFFLPVL